MMKLRSKMFSKSISKLSGGSGNSDGDSTSTTNKGGEIKWEVRPGGMLVQKRECNENNGERMINIRVSTISKCHDISIQSISTFGELKLLLSIITNLGPKEQRLLFKGKEREDNEHLHMIGVRDKDKVLMLEDPAIKERKLRGLTKTRLIRSNYHTITAN